MSIRAIVIKVKAFHNILEGKIRHCHRQRDVEVVYKGIMPNGNEKTNGEGLFMASL
jgi:hypothetical protein